MVRKDDFDGVAGFRITAGQAVGVLVGGLRERPRLLARSTLPLSSRVVEGSLHPYHSAPGVVEKDENRIAARILAIRRIADNSASAAVRDWGAAGFTAQMAALVVGTLKPPEAIVDEPTRAKILEDQLFRTVLAEALAANGIASVELYRRKLYHEASLAVHRTVAEVRQTAQELGTMLEGRWLEEHKLAAAAAWMYL